MEDKYIGKRFYRLVILNKVSKGRYLCQCDCGNKKDILIRSIIKKKWPTKSCGCYAKTELKGRNSSKWKDLTGQKFSRLTFLRFLDEEKVWECQCDCGKIIKRQSAPIVFGNTKSCGCYSKEVRKNFRHSAETKKKISNANLGENNGMWKGNKVKLIPLHEWVSRHKEKPNLCECCKKVPPFDLANISPKYNPKTYTRDLDNWEWLCRKCHMKKDGRMKNLTHNH